MVSPSGMTPCAADWYDIRPDCEVSGCVKCRMPDDETLLYDTDAGGKAVTPSSAVPQSSWPPVGQRCWRWPTSGKVVLPYSTADGGNKGIDIAGTRGQPVYAAGAGKVVYVGNQLRGYGNLIMIKHSEDYITAYAHNDKLMVNNGQSVKAGQQIATMGSTDADSVRLHFQIRYRATAIDPLRYLPPQGSKPKC